MSPAAVDELYSATGLTPEIVADPDARIEPDQLRRAWAEAIRLTGDPLLALHVAALTPPGSLGIVEYVVRSAPTIGEGIALGVRYLNVLDDVIQAELVDTEVEDHVALRIVVDSPIPQDACFAVVVANARVLAGDFHPVAVDFTSEPPGDPDAYARFFAAPVRFGAPETQMVMSRASLAAPLVSADPGVLSVLTRHADELLARRAAPEHITAQVRRALCDTLRTGEVDVEHVAARLGITPRSLQRRLKDEGTTFQLVRDDVRRELASSYLASRLSIAEVSFLLGFSEASAFFRAFKRWTGMTPEAARRRAHDA